MKVWVQYDLVVPEFRLVHSSMVFLASGVRYTLQLFLRPGLGFDRAGNQMAVGRLGLVVEGLQVVAKVDLHRSIQSLA
jgi:hypothetical protein